MSEEDWTYLAARSDADFPNGLFRIYFRPSLNAIGRTAQDVATLAIQARASANAAAGSLATQLALGTPANGVGNEPMDLPRMVVLNSGGFQPWDMALSLYPNTQNATYQITPHDAGKLLLCTNGTRTWTLPVATDVWPGWTCRLRNRSGATLTLNTGAAADAINGGTAGVGITVATGSAILTVVCTGSAFFEVA
jgi:hypothetical protein